MTQAILFFSDHIQRYIPVSEIRKVELSWDSPYQFWHFPKIMILHKYLVGVSILFLSDWCFCFELCADLLGCQIFRVVRYYMHDRYYVHYCNAARCTKVSELNLVRIVKLPEILWKSWFQALRDNDRQIAVSDLEFRRIWGKLTILTRCSSETSVHQPALPFSVTFVLPWQICACPKSKKRLE